MSVTPAIFVAARGNPSAVALRANDATPRERYFNVPAAGLRIRVIDQGMMGLTLERGVLHRVGTHRLHL